jgi:hypothetical protein
MVRRHSLSFICHLSESCIRLSFNNKEPVAVLESAYKNGEVKDPIEALILLEKARNAEHIGAKFIGYIILCFLLPFVLSWLASLLLPRLYPSYNFYWGDYMSVYDKRKNSMEIFWTVIVLGVLVSLVAGLLLRIM